MNRPLPSDDDRAPKAGSSYEPPAFRVALIDLTTSQIVIDIGEPATDGRQLPPSETVPARRIDQRPRDCARGPLRVRMAQTRARRFGPGPSCS